MRALDWRSTSLGEPDRWPLSLRGAVSLLLNSRYPMFLAWGDELAFLYNDGYRPIFGEKHPAALGRPFARVWPEIWDDVRPLVDRALAGQATWSENLPLIMSRRGFPEEVYFTFSYSPVRGDDGEIAGMFCACSETTADVLNERRWKTLRDLAAATAYAVSAANACRLAVDVIGANAADSPFVLAYLLDEASGELRLVGAAGCRAGDACAPEMMSLVEAGDAAHEWPVAPMLVRSAHTIRGIDPSAGLPGSPWPEPASTAVIRPLARSTQGAPRGYLIVGTSPRLPFDASYERYVDLLANGVATAATHADAHEAERKRTEALAELDRAKTAFFSNVSHEFRTPLTLMLGPLDDLIASRAAELPAASREQLELVHRNSLRMLRLVNSMLDFSRIEAGRVRATYQPTDLGPLTTDLASSFRSACERAGLELIVDCPPLPEPVYVDRDMWEKIVLNLLSNAFKFTLEGEIEVRLEKLDDAAVLSVRDTGVGIPVSELPRMFDRFHRIPENEGRTHEGTGIGLALVHELVKLHGGEVRVESSRSVGSRFVVSIPFGARHLDARYVSERAEPLSGETMSAAFVEEALRWVSNVEESLDRPGEERLLPAAEPRRAGQPLRVLLADDNADMRAYLERLLGTRFDVEAVDDGETAFAAARQRRPDLVLADVMMPRLDGFELLEALRADTATADVPVILLSGRAGEESRIEGMQAGADDYVVKPFSARELLARVETHAQAARLRREMTQALRHRSAEFATLLERAPLGVYLVDAELRIREVNPLAVAAFGAIADDLVGRDFDAIIHRVWDREYADELVGAVRRTLITGEPCIVRERSALRRDRDVVEYYEWQVDRIPLPDGSRGVVCYFRDVSAHVRARSTVEESREALRAADRKKDAFLATLSHELRSPLAPLRAALEIVKLLADADDGPRSEALDVMERQLDHLTRLTDDLLDVARITQGKLRLRRERLELTSIVRSAVEDARGVVEARRHTLSVALPDEPIAVDGDRVRLGQIIGNLLDNAAKYTPTGGRITVGVTTTTDGARIAVRDNGIGIAPERLGEVFEPFGQLDDSIDRRERGLGIGLSLAKTLVELHGGTIESRSAGLGSGSEFSVWLPAASAPGRAVARHNGGSSKQPQAKRVLIVDDNRDGANALAVLVQMLGHETRTAHDGLEAMAAAEEFRPDIALLDIGLPKLDGYELARRIRAAPWSGATHLAAVTGWAQEADRRKAMAAGFDQHLTKPLTLDGLRAVLDEIPR